MSGLKLCSRQVNIPYYINDIDINIYSIEELGYYLYNHVYLVDEEFFNDSLIDYIDDVLQQKFIADGIRQARAKGSSLVEIISYVAKSSSYYAADELAKFQKELDLIGTKSGVERLKAKADILMNCQKYRSAFQCYNYILLKRRDSKLGPEFYGNLYNNMGVVCANMFMYKDAAEYFKQAYKQNRSLTILKHLIMVDILMEKPEVLHKDVETYNISDKMVRECRIRINDASSVEKEVDIDKYIHEYRIDN